MRTYGLAYVGTGPEPVTDTTPPPPAVVPEPRRMTEALAAHVAAYADPEETLAVTGADEVIDQALAGCDHEFGPLWGVDGIAYAWCHRCSATVHRAPCEVCNVLVAAMTIADTGRPRHRHHPAPEQPSQGQA